MYGMTQHFEHQFLTQIGDELASMDPAPAEAHNYFALLDIPPNELLIRLINQRGFVPGVFKVAELLGRDPVQDFLASAILLAKSAGSLSCIKTSITPDSYSRIEGIWVFCKASQILASSSILQNDYMWNWRNIWRDLQMYTMRPKDSFVNV